MRNGTPIVQITSDKNLDGNSLSSPHHKIKCLYNTPKLMNECYNLEEMICMVNQARKYNLQFYFKRSISSSWWSPWDKDSHKTYHVISHDRAIFDDISWEEYIKTSLLPKEMSLMLVKRKLYHVFTYKHVSTDIICKTTANNCADTSKDYHENHIYI